MKNLNGYTCTQVIIFWNGSLEDNYFKEIMNLSHVFLIEILTR